MARSVTVFMVYATRIGSLLGVGVQVDVLIRHITVVKGKDFGEVCSLNV